MLLSSDGMFIVFSFWQPEKAYLSMFVIPFGKDKLTKELQFANIYAGIFFILSGKTTVSSNSSLVKILS